MSLLAHEESQLFKSLPEELDHTSHTCLRLGERDRGFDEVAVYAALHLTETQPESLTHYAATGIRRRRDGDSDEEDDWDTDDELEAWECGVRLGENCVVPVSFEGEKLWIWTRMEGPAVTTECGPEKFRELYLFAPGKGSIDILKRFVKTARKDIESSKKGKKFDMYRWHLKRGFWARYGEQPGRLKETIILSGSMGTDILEDAKDFYSAECRHWYGNHGIPYKRSILLYGPPGSGKSSVIKMIATECKRSVCFLQPVGMSDTQIADAMDGIPRRSILVLEDVDALFAAGRESKGKQKLTFSGVLNALDGLVSPQNGQLIIMTSNHPERLDPAMVRSGRVDRRFELSSPSGEQAVKIFKSFYPDAYQPAAEEFARCCTEAAQTHGHPLSMASLQNLLIMGRKLECEQFLASLPKFIKEEWISWDLKLVEKDGDVKQEENGVKKDENSEDENSEVDCESGGDTDSNCGCE